MSVASSGVMILRGRAKNSEKNLSECHFVHYKSHVDFMGLEF
jgi:hypothetical protein